MRARLFDVTKDQTGSVLVEFSLVLPVLAFLILGLAQFGLIFYNYILVTNAATTGARELSISRLDTNAYCDVVNAINAASGGLGGTASCSSNLTITLSVSSNGTAFQGCTTGSSCQSDLQTAYNAASIPPYPVEVTVSYSVCNPTDPTTMILPATLLNIASLCSLTSTMQQAVE
jgi:Flp pilus assembly protein TadG